MTSAVKPEHYNEPATPRQLRRLLELQLIPGMPRPRRGPTAKLIHRLEREERALSKSAVSRGRQGRAIR